MRIKSSFFKVVAVAILLIPHLVNAQSLPVGTPVLEDFYRRQQLIGKVDSNISFALRPIYPLKSANIKNVFDPEGNLDDNNWTKATKVTFDKGRGRFDVLPLIWQQQYNSDHPYGWNDGMMIPAKGYQTLISGGFFLKYGPLSIQFRPEYVFAANNAFPGYANNRTDADLVAYYYSHTTIDNPERYGSSAFNRASLGQSSIRLTFGAISFGLSNENLWWGPGIRNALILSNNAEGFKHITINTVRPIKTFLGSFEAQIIGAHLENTGMSPLAVTATSAGKNLYEPLRPDWRYYTGFNFIYQPKWLPGLFLGLTRSFDSYHNDVKTLANYVPFFFPYTKVSTGEQGDPIPRDQVTSIYGRLLLKKAHAEIYFEYGLNDNSYNFNDLIGAPQHSRAYLAGFRKMILLNNRVGEGILVSGEITQLSQTLDRFVRDAGTWYVHGEVKQGMTNYGQVLGAGTGPGGNLQSTDISWVRGLKKLGVMFERYEHDVDFFDLNFAPINGHSRKWVDFGFGFIGDWNYKNLLINAKLEGIQSLNYEWILKNYNSGAGYRPNNTVFNLHTELGLTYRF